MPDKKERKYLLTIKRDNNDYLPLEWQLTNLYEGENLFSLEGIDQFTSKTTRPELVREVLNENMIDGKEKYESFAIIYYEKGKTRELKDGTIFQEDENVLSEENFILFIMDNIENKAILNQIYNACACKETEPKLEEFKFILKNIAFFINKGKNAVYAALSTFKNISYEKKRSIILKTSKRILSKQSNKQKAHLTKTDHPNYEGKVA